MNFLEFAGSYSKGDNWTVIRDIKVRGGVVHDLTDLPIPFLENDTFDGIYSEHFIEHLTKEEGINIFKESFRLLKSGGTLRTVWPSMDFIDILNSSRDLSNDKFVNLYTTCIIDREKPFNKSYYKDINTDLRKQELVALRLLHQEGEHKHLWYRAEMIKTLESLGFKDVKVMPYQESRLKEFNNIDHKQEMRPLHSTVIEATK